MIFNNHGGPAYSVHLMLHVNKVCRKKTTFIQNNNQIHFELIIGNHDILPDQKYKEIGLINHGEALVIDSLIFTHHPLTQIPTGFINFSGHIHPGYRLDGIGRQSITMPCFFRKNGNFILPAFGNLTGLKIMQKDKATEIFGISGSKIFKI